MLYSQFRVRSLCNPLPLPSQSVVPLSAHRWRSGPCRSLCCWSLALSCRSFTETYAVNTIIKRLKKSTAEATPDVAVTTDCCASVLGRSLCKGFVETPSSTRTPCALPSLIVELRYPEQYTTGY